MTPLQFSFECPIKPVHLPVKNLFCLQLLGCPPPPFKLEKFSDASPPSPPIKNDRSLKFTKPLPTIIRIGHWAWRGIPTCLLRNDFFVFSPTSLLYRILTRRVASQFFLVSPRDHFVCPVLSFSEMKEIRWRKVLGFPRKSGKPGLTWLTGSYAPAYQFITERFLRLPTNASVISHSYLLITERFIRFLTNVSVISHSYLFIAEWFLRFSTNVSVVSHHHKVLFSSFFLLG